MVNFALSAGIIVCLQLPIAAPLRAMVLGKPPIDAVVRIDGDLILNQETVGKVRLSNASSRTATIIGVNRSCRCFDFRRDPVRQLVPSNGQLALPLVIKPNKLGPLHQRVVLFSDHPEQARVNVNLFGFVKGVE